MYLTKLYFLVQIIHILIFFFRNALLEAKGYPMPSAQKTGTTIVGIVVKDGVVLGADTRATEDNVVADKYSEKIHYLAKNM